jgi:membrane peptidoglycan carboxypeptidase
VSTEVARAAIDMARCPVGDQSAFDECRGATARGVHDTVDHPVAGKTGTTDSNRTASLVVTTTTLAVAGIMADPDFPETPESMDHNKINPAVYETLADAMKGKPKVDFPAPSHDTAYGNQKTIPDVSCDSVDAARSRLQEAGFEVKVDPAPVPSNCAQGTVAYSEPNRRSVEGATITLKISAGAPRNKPTKEPDPGTNDRPNGTGPTGDLLDHIFPGN